MHAVLDLESNRPVPEDDETLEEGLSEACTGCFLVHDDGSELLMITNEDDLFTAENERNHALFINECENQRSFRNKAR